jgi:hypothetical protein
MLLHILAGLSLASHKQAGVDMIRALFANPPAMFLTGTIALPAGLLGHNIWSGGALPVLVTAVGWISLLKGLALLFLPPVAAAEFFLGTLMYERLFYVYAGFSLMLGLCLIVLSEAQYRANWRIWRKSSKSP